jgi:predicted nuclease with TOPRIM domain
MERQLAATAELRRKSVAVGEYTQTRERVEKWKAKVSEEEERCGQLQEKFRRWMAENEKPQKRQRVEHDVLEESRKRIREAVRELKKFLQNSHMRAGKKYEELIAKMEGYRCSPHALQQQFQQLQGETEKVPYMVNSGRVSYEQWLHSVEKVVDTESLNHHELTEAILEQTRRPNSAQ